MVRISNIDQVQRWLKNYPKILRRRFLGAHRRALGDVFEDLVVQSPVAPPDDPDPGRFRASWRFGVGSADTSVAPPLRPSYPVPNRQTAGINRVRLEEAAIISNSIDYAEKLARGWSKQAPAGWIDASFLSYKIKFGQHLRQMLNEIKTEKT